MDITQLGASYSAMRPEIPCLGPEDERRKQVAKEFEGVFVRQLLERMKDTIDEFEADDEEQDSSAEQIKGMFWSFLGDAVAEQGGFGLWERIYEAMPENWRGSNLDERA
jgi:Rod binding domain-containing protein